ncbi:MAG TPA: type II toxin-antitoxin system RelE/ParE family toxin [Tepidisphaeraceae bacterium]|jgi:toxin ParE1/3/4|nr:type II toxin-antitoxin system RelE/ParE family toxin [Tepidisphaeraceae bacterium]
MTRTIRTPQADRDLIEHFARIALDKIEPAERFIKIAEDSFKLLSEMPGIGRVWDTNNPRLAGTRLYPLPHGYRNYLVFYRIIPNGIEVIRVLQGARDLEDLLDHS